eukprot:NODE_2547_length_1553_cov_52.639860_g2193_i0.p1 GENE.NODE_2547_length_1553_cov_52.639860_g2193_i0~~NODE_2547_length_1553_cov_52.639860_g2193_i0.p1  ORF type:complete len:447 (-),score=86.72 NODE_2547_length_1553_cov_52.639860_g2193_i0:161-1501(-)
MANINWDNLQYLNGFGNHFATESLPNALPKGQNTPQKCPYGLYAEQLSGTAFTAPRSKNQRTWLYRIMPTCKHLPFVEITTGLLKSDFSNAIVNPNQLRWNPLPIPGPEQQSDFVDGLITFCGSGSPDMKAGLAIHLYVCNRSMENRVLCNSDGDFLIVPQQGALRIKTEYGLLKVNPGEICVIQRCIKFQVLIDEPSRGYICEVYQSHFILPDLGPIGANGLANPRDFETPVAWYEDIVEEYTLVQKFMGKLFHAKMDRSPFDVVAWHGNYCPYKYDLEKFNTVNSVSYDHLDPCIFVVLTAPSGEPGVAVCDFVIFPPRFMVQENTFRIPYYHRNVMSEYMGNIKGVYEAKLDGFLPGGGSLHSVGVGHGPDHDAFKKASLEHPQVPVKSDPNALAFMFESTYMYRLTEFAQNHLVQDEYYKCWQPLQSHFDPTDEKPNLFKTK